MFTVIDKDKIECNAEVNFKKPIKFPQYRALRIVALLSLGINALLLLSLWILEARISKLEQKHIDPTPLEISFGKE